MPHISKQHTNFWSTFNTYIKISMSAFPCVYKSRGTGKGKLFRRPSNLKPARRHYFSRVSENSWCTFDFKVINSAGIFQPYLYPYRRTQQKTGLVNEFLSLLLVLWMKLKGYFQKNHPFSNHFFLSSLLLQVLQGIYLQMHKALGFLALPGVWMPSVSSVWHNLFPIFKVFELMILIYVQCLRHLGILAGTDVITLLFKPESVLPHYAWSL